VLGTPHYLSPEQARGETNLDPRVDLYALGVVLYELLSGQTPFDRPGYMQVLAAICRETAKPIRALVPDVPVEVEAIIAKAMARERDARYANALEMLADIEAVLAALPEPHAAPVPEMPSGELVTADIPIRAPIEDEEEPVTEETEAAPDALLGPGSTLQGFPAQAPPPILPTRESLPLMERREVVVAPPAGGTWIMAAAIGLGIAGAVMLIASIWG
jgi:serine/threonine protein kinase